MWASLGDYDFALQKKMGMGLVLVLDCHYLYCFSLGQVLLLQETTKFLIGLLTSPTTDLAMDALEGLSMCSARELPVITPPPTTLYASRSQVSSL